MASKMFFNFIHRLSYIYVLKEFNSAIEIVIKTDRSDPVNVNVGLTRIIHCYLLIVKERKIVKIL